MPLIDNSAPVWQFREVHKIGVLAPADAAMRAIREVTAREIHLFRLLTWLRRAGRPGPESLINPPPGCRFAPRCSHAMPECRAAIPPLRDVGGGHKVACVLWPALQEAPQ